MNELGQPSIQEIFQPLHTRLYKIQNGDLEPEDGVYIEVEDYCARKIQTIVSAIFSFDPSVGLKLIVTTLALIEELDTHGKDLFKGIQNYSGFGWKILEGAEARGQADKEIKMELAYYKEKLKNLQNHLSKNISISSSTRTLNQPEIELPVGFKIPSITGNSIIKLDKYQAGLLFHFLKSHGAIRAFSAKSLATLVSYLTGFSEQNLRADVFGNIWNVMKDKEKNKTKNENNYNLMGVRNLLTEVLIEIDRQIKINESTK